MATSKPSRFNQRFWAGVIGAALAVGLGLSALYLKFGLGLVHLSYDMPYAIRPTIWPQEAVVIGLDEDSHLALNQPLNAPWSRDLHAQLLERLSTEGAKAVVFDIVFSGPGRDVEADDRFAKAIHAMGKVVLAADVRPAGYGRDAVAAKKIDPPLELFRDAGGEMASAEMNPDDDLILRQHLMILPDDDIYPMSWVAAKLVGAEVTKDDKDRPKERWRNYYGPAATVPNVSYSRAFTNSDDYLPMGYFSNKVVFVGARMKTVFAGERKDEFPTPHTRWTKESMFMPGVEIQATTFLNLLRGDWLTRLPDVTERILISFIGRIIGFGLIRLRPIVATGVSLLFAIAVTVSAYLSFRYYLHWFPWLIIVAIQIPIALAWSIVFNSVQLYVQNKLFEKSLEMYLSPKLVKKFAANKDLLKPGAKKGNLTILFSDIASFTSISEGMDSDDLAKHMNLYFETAVGKCIHHTDGTIVKYIGDAIFAFWNAPDPQDDHKLRAVEAAVAFRNLPPQHMNGQLLVTRIGLHTGVANVGNFGSTARVDYTALGENINLAARMEGLNKYLGTICLLTAETHDGIEGKFTTRFLGNFQLKGFEKSVGVHELIGKLEMAEEVRPLHEAFAAALKLFQEKKLAEAEAAFQKILETNPKDGPSKFYIKHLAELKEHPPEGEWTGEVELKEK